MLSPEGREKARQAIGFVSGLTHVEGTQFAGKPFAPMLWQVRLLRKLFGTLKPDGYRQYRTCYLEIPKKNGKSELGAAVALKLLCADGEIGAEVYSVASDKEQAGIVFRKAAQMVRNSPDLDARLQIIDSQKRIVDYKTNSFYRVLSSDVKTKHGFNPHGVIFDELHAQPNRELWDVLTVGTDAARKQQLVFVMTTAGFDRHSICREVHDHALSVRDGLEDPRFLPIFYGVSETANWEDETEWVKANPSLGKIFNIDNLRDEYREAKQIPAKENEFRRLRLNQWTEQKTRWLSLDNWKACGGQIDVDNLTGRLCYAGLDLATTVDIAAYVLFFPDWASGGRHRIIPHFFVPEENIKKRVKRDKVPYDVWVKKGLVYATPGNTIDYRYIESKVLETSEKYNIQEIKYDRAFAAHIVQNLMEQGLNMTPVGQGFLSMSPPMKELEKWILSGSIMHGDNPVLTWMFNNVAVEMDAAGNIKPNKAKSSEKIDGIVALIMAADGAIRNGEGTSIYETRGIVTVDSEVEKKEEPKEEEVVAIDLTSVDKCPRCKTIIPAELSACPGCGRRR